MLGSLKTGHLFCRMDQILLIYKTQDYIRSSFQNMNTSQDLTEAHGTRFSAIYKLNAHQI